MDLAFPDRTETQAALERHARREIARAREAVQRLITPRQCPGIGHYLPYWVQVNHAEECLRCAIRAYRFARGNSPIQTFGTALRDHAKARGYIQ